MSAKDRLILAIDPSIEKPGWAVFRVPTGLLVNPRDVAALYVDSGCWYTESHHDPASRLAYLAEQCEGLCEQYPPTRAFVEIPAVAGLYAGRKRLASGAAKSAGSREAALGMGVGVMQQAVGAFLATLGRRCPTETVRATNPSGAKRGQAKAARRAIVLSYWPTLADRPEDEIDAIHLALTVTTDARRWRKQAA